MNFIDAFGTIAFVVILAIGLLVVTAWIVLPFKVVNRLDKIVAATEALVANSEKPDTEPVKPPAPIPRVIPQAPKPSGPDPMLNDPDIIAHIARKQARET